MFDNVTGCLEKWLAGIAACCSVLLILSVEPLWSQEPIIESPGVGSIIETSASESGASIAVGGNVETPVVGAEHEQPTEYNQTEIFYLTKSIDDSLQNLFFMLGEYEKEPITDNASLRSVWIKTLSVVAMFARLGVARIDEERLSAAGAIPLDTVGPREIYDLLALVRDKLNEKGAYTPYQGQKEEKNYSDIYQMLRQLTFHFVESAQWQGLSVDWGKTEASYDLFVTRFLPLVEDMAREAGMTPKGFRFPRRALSDIKPRHVYMLEVAMSNNIAAYYAKKEDDAPMSFIQIKDLDSINPLDVIDVIRIYSAELEAMIGEKSLSPEMMQQYEKWRSRRDEVLPGDLFQLVQYGFIISRRLAKRQEN